MSEPEITVTVCIITNVVRSVANVQATQVSIEQSLGESVNIDIRYSSARHLKRRSIGIRSVFLCCIF